MEIGHLKYFYSVAKERGFSRASKQLRVAQPAISKMVRHLEEDLGFNLFERRPREVILTKRGGDLFRYCEVIFDQWSAIQKLSHNSTPAAGPVQMGATEAVASFLLTAVIEDLRGSSPDVYPSVTVGATKDLLKKLSLQELDIVFAFFHMELPEHVVAVRHFPVEHVVVISAKHARQTSTQNCFIGSREIEDPSTQSFPTLRRLQKQNPKIRIVASTNSNSTQLDLVKRGLGIAVLPKYVVEADLRAKRLKAIFPTEKLEWPLLVLVNKRRNLLTAGEIVLNLFEKHFV